MEKRFNWGFSHKKNILMFNNFWYWFPKSSLLLFLPLYSYVTMFKIDNLFNTYTILELITFGYFYSIAILVNHE
jgi:hypothetical protein